MAKRANDSRNLAKSKQRKSLTSGERAYRRTKLPDCIGRFPECEGYKPDDPIDKRPECKNCPFNGELI